MSELDLNIHNYDLRDLLNLFKLPVNFDGDDLKSAKLMMLKTHPDKSNLDKKYFLFFQKAYNKVKQVYEFRSKRKKDMRNVTYDKNTNDITNAGNKELLKKFNGQKASVFNKQFNELFEKTKIKDGANDTGYGEWYKNEEEETQEKAKSTSDFENIFEKRKKITRELIVHEGVREMCNGGGYSLDRDRPNEYSSDIFSKLKYEDLKKAHTETVVPVTREDYERMPKYKNYKDMMNVRKNQDTTPVSLKQANSYLNKRRNNETRTATETAFKLVQQDEEVEEMTKQWWGYLRQLKN